MNIPTLDFLQAKTAIFCLGISHSLEALEGFCEENEGNSSFCALVLIS